MLGPGREGEEAHGEGGARRGHPARLQARLGPRLPQHRPPREGGGARRTGWCLPGPRRGDVEHGAALRATWENAVRCRISGPGLAKATWDRQSLRERPGTPRGLSK